MESWKSLFRVMQLMICLSIALACSDVYPPQNISKTLLSIANGAMCLDGSPAAYFFDQGEGEGVDNWLIFLEGGGWCATPKECKYRAASSLGSSNDLPAMRFGHIISNHSKGNPEFCNWNRIHVHYCDGSSFTSDVETVDSTTNVTYRGARIFTELLDELIGKGMDRARNAILAGSSAGGLATIIHCDRFRSRLPDTTKVKCLPDSAFFLHDEYLQEDKRFDKYFEGLVGFQGSTPMLHSSCISKSNKPSLCFFPQYILQDVVTPLFLVMSSFDQIQISYNLSPYHVSCLLSKNCTLAEMASIEGIRKGLIDALPIGDPSFRGIWVTSCITHEITMYSWIAPLLLRIHGNKTYSQVFVDWFYDRSAVQIIDQSTERKNCSDYGIRIKSDWS